MKKILILIGFIFSLLATKAQAPITHTLGSTTTDVKSKGVLSATYGYTNGAWSDTATANATYIVNIPGIQIRVGDTLFLRNATATKWLRIIMNGIDSVVSYKNGCSDTLKYWKAGVAATIDIIEHINGLVNGTGIVTRINDTTFHVTRAVFYLNCNRYTTPDTTVRIAHAGDTGRIDLIVGNTNSTVNSIQGTEGTVLTIPSYTSTQFPLAFILVTDTSVTFSPPAKDSLWLGVGTKVFQYPGKSGGQLYGAWFGSSFFALDFSSGSTIYVPEVYHNSAGAMNYSIRLDANDSTMYFYDNSRGAKVLIWDKLGRIKIPTVTNVTDTTTYKPEVSDGSGNFRRLDHWPVGNGGVGTLQQVTDAGNTTTNFLRSTEGYIANDVATQGKIVRVQNSDNNKSITLDMGSSANPSLQFTLDGSILGILKADNILTSSKTWQLPNNSGTVALTSDIPAAQNINQVLATGNTLTATRSIDDNSSGTHQFGIGRGVPFLDINLDATGIINVDATNEIDLASSQLFIFTDPGQVNITGIDTLTSSPQNTIWIDNSGNLHKGAYSGGGGSGLISFSAGNLSPLFTTSVATATTTPALSFSLSNAAGKSVFSNSSGSSGTPAFNTLDSSYLTGMHTESYFNTKYAPISVAGTVTSVARTNGYAISASVASSTTTPNITIAVDTSVLFPRVRAIIHDSIPARVLTFNPIHFTLSGDTVSITGTATNYPYYDANGLLTSDISITNDGAGTGTISFSALNINSVTNIDGVSAANSFKTTDVLTLGDPSHSTDIEIAGNDAGDPLKVTINAPNGTTVSDKITASALGIEPIYLSSGVAGSEGGLYATNGDGEIATWNTSSGVYRYGNGMGILDDTHNKAIINAATVQFSSYGAGILISNASGNITSAPNNLPIAGHFSGVGTATTAFTVAIGSTMTNSTYVVNVTPTAALSAALFYISAKSTTTFTVTYLAGLTGTVTFDWNVTPIP